MKFLNTFDRIIFQSLLFVFAPLLITIPVYAQYNYSNWVMKNASDTTVVRCWNDSATTIMFTPGSMSGMMMMNMPDSIFCRIDEMPMDSLSIVHDSTFIGWYRMQVGSDSLNFNMMSYSGMGSGNMMQFSKNFVCHLYWDSLAADSMYQHWHPTDIMAWNGSKWIAVSGSSLSNNTATFSSSNAYSAVAFIGEPSKTTGLIAHGGAPVVFSLSQNYPNPFNPTTQIAFDIAQTERVNISIFNILGQRVATIIDGEMSAGSHVVTWNGQSQRGELLASGVYFYRLSTPSFTAVKKMLLLK